MRRLGRARDRVGARADRERPPVRRDGHGLDGAPLHRMDLRDRLAVDIGDRRIGRPRGDRDDARMRRVSAQRAEVRRRTPHDPHEEPRPDLLRSHVDGRQVAGPVGDRATIAIDRHDAGIPHVILRIMDARRFHGLPPSTEADPTRTAVDSPHSGARERPGALGRIHCSTTCRFQDQSHRPSIVEGRRRRFLFRNVDSVRSDVGRDLPARPGPTSSPINPRPPTNPR